MQKKVFDGDKTSFGGGRPVFGKQNKAGGTKLNANEFPDLDAALTKKVAPTKKDEVKTGKDAPAIYTRAAPADGAAAPVFEMNKPEEKKEAVRPTFTKQVKKK